MAAPIRKVAPNAFNTNTITNAINAGEAALLAGESKPIHDSLSVFGVVVSSTAPQSLQRATSARANIRRVLGLR
jgi:hypothetical protein